MPDFSELLAKPADEIKKPEPIPQGTYLGTISGMKFAEAKTPKDQEMPVKPVCELSVGLNEAMDDVDQEELATFLESGATISGRKYNYTLWLTSDALYRVIDLATSLGIETSGRSLGEIISELPNQAVMVSIVHVQSTRKGQEDTIFANIDSLATTLGD